MAGWEFTYVDLHVEYRGEAIEPTKRAHDRARDAAIDRVKDAIAQLGHEGWEPVGQIVFAFDRGGPAERQPVDVQTRPRRLSRFGVAAVRHDRTSRVTYDAGT
jgi:hypothetical protein